MDDLLHIFPPEPATSGVLERLEDGAGRAVVPPSRGSYRDPAHLASEDMGLTYQRCGGGRRVIRKKIRSE